jgi:hypothetical protein
VDNVRVGLLTGITTAQAYPHGGFWRVGGDTVAGWPYQPSSFFFNGSIDEVAVYPTALSAAQVNTHWHNSGR